MSGRRALLKFLSSGPIKQFFKGETILHQGDRSSAVFTVRKGYVKAYDIASDGSEQLVWIIKPGETLPIELLFSEEGVVPYFYAAFTDVEVYSLTKSDLLSSLRSDSDALMMAVERMVDKYRLMLSHLSAVQKPKARDKIMHLLHFIAMRFSHKEAEGVGHVEVPLTHQDLANLVGLARETTTLELRKLKQQGIIDYDKNNFYIKTNALAEAM